MLDHLWPIVLAQHPLILLQMAQGAAMGWVWLRPPVTARVA